jgi:hypothetical protein
MMLLLFLIPAIFVGMFFLILWEGLCNLIEELRFW